MFVDFVVHAGFDGVVVVLPGTGLGSLEVAVADELDVVELTSVAVSNVDELCGSSSSEFVSGSAAAKTYCY